MGGIYQNSGRIKPPCLDAEGGTQLISAAITICGNLFGDEPDIPMREELTYAEWDSTGSTVVFTGQDPEGGGATAIGWMQNLVDSLHPTGYHPPPGWQQLRPDPQPASAIGYQYDPTAST